MGILDNNSIPPTPMADMAADRLKGLTRSTFQQMAMAFNIGSQLFWKNSDASPADIATALGSDAKEVFELHYKLGQLIGSVKPDSISEGLNVIGNFTMNEDGTVTIIPSDPVLPAGE